MNEHEFDTDMMDAIAMTMAKHFRSLIEKIAHGPASSFPDGVKLRAYRILEQDLRKALGVEGKVVMADAQPRPQVEDSPPAEAMCQAERDALAYPARAVEGFGPGCIRPDQNKLAMPVSGVAGRRCGLSGSSPARLRRRNPTRPGQ